MKKYFAVQNKTAYIYGGLAILLWSTVAAAFKIALKGLNITSLLFIASWTSFLALFLIMIKEKKVKSFFVKRKISLVGVLNPFLYYLILFRAYDLLSAQEAQVLNYTWPIALTLLSKIFLGDKIPVKRYLGITISFFGIIMIATKAFKYQILSGGIGIFFALFSSIVWASYWLINKKSDEDELVKMCTNFFVGSICISIYGFWMKEIDFGTLNSFLAAFYVGLFEMGITFLFWAKGLKLIDRNDKLVRLSYLSPFISLVFITIFLKEPILKSTILGLVFIIFGLLF